MFDIFEVDNLPPAYIPSNRSLADFRKLNPARSTTRGYSQCDLVGAKYD
jgi:hypothetical protein